MGRKWARKDFEWLHLKWAAISLRVCNRAFSKSRPIGLRWRLRPEDNRIRVSETRFFASLTFSCTFIKIAIPAAIQSRRKDKRPRSGLDRP